MNVKGISFFEQHIEKLVLGAVFLFAVALSAMTFLSPGKSVTIDGREVSAGEIDPALKRKAEGIQLLLSDDMESTIATPQAPGVLAWFERQRENPISPSDTYLAQIPQYAPHMPAAIIRPPEQFYVVPEFRAASRPFVVSHTDTLTLEALDELSPQMRNDLFTDGAGYDVSWATVAAVLDVRALLEQYATPPADPDGKELQIPVDWYRRQLFIWDILLEREELVDGVWGSPLTVEHIYRDLRDFRREINDRESPLAINRKDQVLDWLEVAENEAQIIQPGFLPTLGESWTQPVEPSDDDGDRPELAGIIRLQQQIAQLESTRARMKAQLDKIGGELGDDPGGAGGNSGAGGGGGSLPPPGGGGRGRGGGGYGGGRIGGGGGGVDLGDDDDGKSGGTERLRRILTKRLHRLDTKLEQRKNDLLEEADRLGIALNDVAAPNEIPNLLIDDRVIVWGHDIMARAGHTYRYRMTVRIYNPFFGHKDALMPVQHDVAITPVVDVETTPWSDPVRIKESTRIFVTRAQPNGGDFGIGSATIEVYKLFEGRWHRKTLALQPGDPIGLSHTGGDTTMSADYDTNAWIVDILRIPGDRDAPGQKARGKVVIGLSDGTTIIRDPRIDQNDPERLELEMSANGA